MVRVSQNRCRGTAKSSVSLRGIRQIFNGTCNRLQRISHIIIGNPILQMTEHLAPRPRYGVFCGSQDP